jgi:hypothetical protein
MIERRGKSQIPKSLESKGQMGFDWSVLYTIENIFSKAIRYCPHTLKKDLKKTSHIEKDMNVQSFGTSRVSILGLPLGSPKEK